MRGLTLLVFVTACGGPQLAATPLVVPVDEDGVDREQLEIAPTAPYATLFAKGQRWQFTVTDAVEVGIDPRPIITCELVAQRAFATARMGFLTCEADRALGTLGPDGVSFNRALPRVGVIATAQGLWFTEHLATVSPLPDDEAGVVAWTTAEPMRLAAKPAPVALTAHADAVGTEPPIDGRIDAFPLDAGDVWCTSTESSVGNMAARWVLCMSAKRGLVGGSTAMATRGIVTGALSWGEAPPPPQSQPFATPLDVEHPTVTLEQPGKGKRAVLAFTAAVDSAQPVAYELTSRAASDNGAGTKAEVEQPVTLLQGEARVTAIEPGGRLRYTFTVAEATATGARATPAVQASLTTLVGAAFTTTVDPDGKVATSEVVVPHPSPMTPRVLAGITESMTTFVALPTEPIAVGATWTATYDSRIGGHDVVITARSKLVSRKGAVAVIATTVSHPPIVSPVDGGQAQLATTATITTVITAGRLVPTRASEEKVIATIEPTPGVANPARRERHELVRRTRWLPK